MMKQLSVVLLLFGSFCLSAQSLPASVVASSGGNFVSSGGSLEWTLGEIMTETYEKSNGYFTQGFHQPTTITVTSIGETPGTEFPIRVYPNPFTDRIIIQRSHGVFQAQLMDLNGRTIISTELNFDKAETQTVEVQPIPRAVYILKLVDVQTSANYHIKIEKF